MDYADEACEDWRDQAKRHRETYESVRRQYGDVEASQSFLKYLAACIVDFEFRIKEISEERHGR